MNIDFYNIIRKLDRAAGFVLHNNKIIVNIVNDSRDGCYINLNFYGRHWVINTTDKYFRTPLDETNLDEAIELVIENIRTRPGYRKIVVDKYITKL